MDVAYNKPFKHNITLIIYKKAISEKDYVKYLGVLIDSTLTWKGRIILIMYHQKSPNLSDYSTKLDILLIWI